MPQLAVRIQASVRFRGKGSAKHNRPLRRRQTLLGRISKGMGVPTPRDSICGLFLRGNRRRNNLQRDAPDQQTRNLPADLPQHNKRRDTPPRRNNDFTTSHGRKVLTRRKGYHHPPDETGIYLSLTPPLPAQARVLAPARRFRQGRPRDGRSRQRRWTWSIVSRREGEVLERSDREKTVGD